MSFSSGASFGSHSTVSQWARSARAARDALLVWIGPLSRTSTIGVIATPSLVVPVFGFANAGVSLSGISWAAVLAPLPLGIAAGLFVGKQIGIFLTTWAAVTLHWAERPEHASGRRSMAFDRSGGLSFWRTPLPQWCAKLPHKGVRQRDLENGGDD